MIKKTPYILVAGLVNALLMAAPSAEPPVPIPVKASDIAKPIPQAEVRKVVNGYVEEQTGLILTPDEIELIKKARASAVRQMVSPYPEGRIAKPIIRAFTYEPDSIKEPRMVCLSQGVLTTFVFSDQQGNPWMLTKAKFDKSLFSDGEEGKTGSAAPTNMLTVSPVRQYAYGTVVVELEGMPTPVIYTLSTGQCETVDVRVDTRVAGRNPNSSAQVMILEKTPDIDPAMSQFLDGLPPQGSAKLTLKGGAGDAWLYAGRVYIRTKLTVLSPAFSNHAGTTDGVHIYVFNKIVPRILASVSGKPTDLLLSE